MNILKHTTRETHLKTIIKEMQMGELKKFEQLLKLLDAEIIRKTRCLKIAKEDQEELAQNIRFNLYKQARTFDLEKEQSFVHCVNVIIKNAKIDFFRKIHSEKYRFNAKMYTLDSYDAELAYSLGDILYDHNKQSIEEMIVLEQYTSSFYKHKKLTTLEKLVLSNLLDGKTKKEISAELNIPIKHVYNAHYRIKNKINRYEVLASLFDN